MRDKTIRSAIVGKRMKGDYLSRFRDVLIINYEWWAGKCNMGFWRGIIYDKDSNEIEADWHTKKQWIYIAEKNRWNWIVIRHHYDRSGDFTIVQKSKKAKSEVRNER